MGLIVRDITVTGFGSYGPRPQRLKLGGQGPVAIIGENGAGKSTIVSKALTWCL
jgi:DNA repair exonuclease SbcCD ATPase subunit